MPGPELLLLFVVSIACGLACTYAARTVAQELGLVHEPNPIVATHATAVPSLGGVAVVSAAVWVLLVAALAADLHVSTALMVRFAIPALAFLCVGVADDVMRFAPAPKFGLQMLAAMVAVSSGNGYVFTGTGSVDALISWLWLLTVVNAFNFIDVCDGLLAGVAAIVFVFLALLLPAIAVPLVAVAGSLLGFLAFNRPPATIFLGDGGSHLLGFAAAATTLMLLDTAGVWPGTAQALFVLVVPLFELVFVTVIRVHKGIPLWKGSPDHFALRLQRGRFTRGRIDLVAWIVGSAGGASALMLPDLTLANQLLLISASAAALSWMALVLIRLDAPFG